MDVVGVIDLRNGRAVHAVAGVRDLYEPVRTAADLPIDGDPAVLARTYVQRLGIRELYVADLDAIVDRRPQDAAVRAIAACGLPLWLDAGITCGDEARRAIRAGAARAIVGLETLRSWAALGEVIDAIGPARVAFSLDLRDGRPMGALDGGAAPAALASRVARMGVTALIVIDLARVGAGAGVDFEMIARVRDAVPHVRLAAGGGVRGRPDLERLAAVGCDAALVATALHDGRVDAATVTAVQTGRADGPDARRHRRSHQRSVSR
jgi:phosphoribosylformimino-5-aminoimidazole carboxamide ribotide isomerase